MILQVKKMTLEEYMKQNKKQNNTDKKNNYRNSIIRRTLLTATLVLIMLIICNLSTKAKTALYKYLLESGLVVFVGQKEPYGSVVVIQQSNGIDVIYGGITSKDIKVYDYIEKGTIIGTCDEKLYLEFQKEGESLDYKPYIK